MASNYLQKFASTLPTTQGQQILALLNQQKDSGQIVTVEELKAALQTLTANLAAGVLQPTLQLFLGAEDQVISSQSYNAMLVAIQNDLASAFAEANSIEDVLSAHQNIVGQVTFTALQQAINQLNDSITLYEFINGNDLGLGTGSYNTFTTTNANGVSQTDTLAPVLYAGFLNTTIQNQLANIDVVAGTLTLGLQLDNPVTVQSVVQVFDATTAASEIDVSFPDSSIGNIIDGQEDTYWIYNTLLSNPAAGGVNLKVQLNLSGTQDINYIEIQPACPFPMTLTDVSYLNNSGGWVDLDIDQVVITADAKLEIGTITAAAVLLTFNQQHYVATQFQQNQVDTNYYSILQGNTSNTPVSLLPITSQLSNIFSSSFLLNDIFGIPSVPVTALALSYYQYLFGWDNISVGLSKYEDESIYVSQPININNPGMVGIASEEIRTALTNGSDGLPLYDGSLEYEIVKQNLDSPGNQIGIDIFPILPYGQGVVLHEYLDLIQEVSGSQINNLGFFRFYPNLSEPVKVYRNGTLLVLNTDWVYYPSLDQNNYLAVAPMEKAIKIVATDVTSIYTISYTPLLSNTLQLPSGNGTTLATVVSLGQGGHIRLLSSNVVATDTTQVTTTIPIVQSNVYLRIVLRKITANNYTSPAVSEYKLLGAEADSNRFQTSFNG